MPRQRQTGEEDGYMSAPSAGQAEYSGRPAGRSGNRSGSAQDFDALARLGGVSSNPLADLPPYPPVPRQVGGLSPYVTVEATRDGALVSEDVLIEPVIRGLSDIGDAELQARVAGELNNLYDFFRRLYDQDQQEISGMQAQLLNKASEVSRLKATNAALETKAAEASAAAAAATAAAAAAFDDGGGIGAARMVGGIDPAGTKGHGSPGPLRGYSSDEDGGTIGDQGMGRDEKRALGMALKSNATPGNFSTKGMRSIGTKGTNGLNATGSALGRGTGGQGSGRANGNTVNTILFLPPHILKIPTLYRWWEWVLSKYREQRIFWLVVIWSFITVLAIILLVALLVPWKKLGNPGYFYSDGTLNMSGAPGRSDASFLLQTPRDEALYYAIVPTSILFEARRRHSHRRGLLQDDEDTDKDNTTQGLLMADVDSGLLIDLVEGTFETYLTDGAVACGSRFLTAGVSYIASVGNQTAGWQQECALLAGDALSPNRCLQCPSFNESVAYTMFVGAASSPYVATINFTTAGPPTPPLPPYPPPGSLGPSYPPPPALAYPPHPRSPLLPPGSPLPPGATAVPVTGSVVVPPPPIAPRSMRPPPPPAPPEAPGRDLVVPSFVAQPTVVAASQDALDISFQLDGPGLVYYAVAHVQVFARQGNVYTAVPAGAPTLPLTPLGGTGAAGVWPGGVVAAGSVRVNGTGQITCRLGRDSAVPSACLLPATCFGDLCTAYPTALAPNTSYAVYLAPGHLTGLGSLGATSTPPSVTTAVPSSAPTLATGAGVAPGSVGAYGFALSGLRQDMQGFTYVLVTRPFDQSPGALEPGQASTLVAVPGGRRRLGAQGSSLPIAHLRALRQVATNQSAADVGEPGSFGLVAYLPPQPALSPTTFQPPCAIALPCDMAWLVGAYVDTGIEALVFQDCLAVTDIGTTSEVLVPGLDNATLYTVKVLATDLAYNAQLYVSSVLMNDLKPPEFTAISQTTAFTSFTLSVTMSEAGVVSGQVVPDGVNATLNAVWPPEVGGTIAAAATCTVTGGSGGSCNMTFRGLTSNSNYRAYLLARDRHANVQKAFTQVFVHTDDNNSPEWLLYDVASSTTTANVTLQLTKPCAVFFQYGLSAVMGGQCPSAAQLYAQDVALGAKAVGPLSFDGLNLLLTQLTGLQDASLYLLCAVAEDTTSFRNRQAVALWLPFETADSSPPVLTAGLVAGSGVECTSVSVQPPSCVANVALSISEKGSVAYALVPSAFLTTFLSTLLPSTLLAATSVDGGVDGVDGGAAAGQLLPTGVVASGRVALVEASAQVTIAVPGLNDATAYALLLVPVDEFGNAPPTLQVLSFNSSDATPPTLVASSAASTADGTISVYATLDEPFSTLFVVVIRSPAASVPSAADVAGGRGAQLATSYDVFWRLTHPANLQRNVTAILAIRTRDSQPPVVTLLSTTYEPPGHTFTLTTSLSKPGSLFYVALPASEPPPVSPADVLRPLRANFSGSMDVPVAGVNTTVTLCVAGGEDLVLYGVAQDGEGAFGRAPNNSTLVVAIALLAPRTPVDMGMCPSQLPAGILNALRFRAGLARGSPGFAVGQMQESLNASSGVATWTQQFSGFPHGGSGAVRSGEVTLDAGGTPLPGTYAYTVRGLPPARVAIVLQTPGLYAEDNDDKGAVLSLVFQLFDAENRTAVDTEGLLLFDSEIGWR
ncbi:hypothetical protein FOA52_000531 [Chlamydomonas sp. UWO 241]|nr:hypothetical protein FOA52_000531 [Chlamydomonas sp. UWO 241]